MLQEFLETGDVPQKYVTQKQSIWDLDIKAVKERSPLGEVELCAFEIPPQSDKLYQAIMNLISFKRSNIMEKCTECGAEGQERSIEDSLETQLTEAKHLLERQLNVTASRDATNSFLREQLAEANKWKDEYCSSIAYHVDNEIALGKHLEELELRNSNLVRVCKNEQIRVAKAKAETALITDKFKFRMAEIKDNGKRVQEYYDKCVYLENQLAKSKQAVDDMITGKYNPEHVQRDIVISLEGQLASAKKESQHWKARHGTLFIIMESLNLDMEGLGNADDIDWGIPS